MEANLERFLIGNKVKEEKTMKSNGDDSDEEGTLTYTNKVPPVTTPGGSSMETTNSRDSSSIQKNQELHEDQLQSANAKMVEVREENERLKLILERIAKDYQSLQMHFFDILKQEAKKSIDTVPTHQEDEEPELVNLSLRIASEPKKDEKKAANSSKDNKYEKFNEGLALGLDCRFDPGPTELMKNPSPENSFEEPKEEAPTEKWPPGKIFKTTRSGDDEVLQQTNLKKARVSVRTRCSTPTMNDGCQWRKYGQKIAKGNPCPRAYYRCTVSPSCPVRKQVQRFSEDMSILITTYEGTHNHPLPISAEAMASTTSAAASMLRSGSSSSRPGVEASASTTTSNGANLHGLNFTLSHNSIPQQFHFPNSSISTSNSHPTITLDLTAPTTTSHFNRLSSSFPSAPRYSSTCLNFSSSSSTSSALQTSWGSGYLSYGTLSYNKNHVGSLNLGRQPPQEHFYQPYLQNNNHYSPSQPSLTETIAAATKEITSNPTFRSALEVAIASFVGNGVGVARENHGVGKNSIQNLRWGESSLLNPAYQSTQNGVGCATSYLNRSSSSNSQQEASLVLFPPSSPFSTSKSASVSPDNRNHIK